MPEPSAKFAQQRDREVTLTTVRHLADAMRQTSAAMAKAAELQAERDAHLDRLAATVGTLAEKVGALTTSVAVADERLNQVRLSQATITDLQGRLRKLEDQEEQRKALAKAGNFLARHWPAMAALGAWFWAILHGKAGS